MCKWFSTANVSFSSGTACNTIRCVCVVCLCLHHQVCVHVSPCMKRVSSNVSCYQCVLVVWVPVSSSALIVTDGLRGSHTVSMYPIHN